MKSSASSIATSWVWEFVRGFMLITTLSPLTGYAQEATILVTTVAVLTSY